MAVESFINKIVMNIYHVSIIKEIEIISIVFVMDIKTREDASTECEGQFSYSGR